MAFSFGNSGATPANTTSNPLSAGTLNLSSSTPQSKALNTAANPFQTTVPGANSSLTPAVNSAINALNSNPPRTSMAQLATGNMPNPGVLAPPAVQPTSHAVTTTDTAGNTTMTKQTYAPPATSSTPSSNAVENPATPATQTSSNPPAGTANGTITSDPTATFPGVVTNLANVSQQGSPQGQQITGQLQNTSNASSPAATQAEQATAAAGESNPAIGTQANQIAQEYAQNIANAENAAGAQYTGYMTGGGGPIGLGRAGAVQNALSNYVTGQSAAETAALQGTGQELTAAQQEAAAENEAGNLANTQQSNVQSGLNEAGSLANTAQSNIQSGLNQAGTLAYPTTLSASSGQYQTSPLTGQGINGGVATGMSALTNFSNAVANNSVAQQYGAQGAQLSTTIGQLNDSSSQVLQAMGLSGANWATTPVANQTIQAYMQNQNPTAAATIQNGLNDLQGKISNILASATGQTPTAVTDAMESVPLNGMSPNQLQSFLLNVQNYAASQLTPIQQTAANAELANGNGTPAVPVYSGTPAVSGAMQGGTQNSTGTAVAGSALSAGASFFQSLLGGLHEAVGGVGAGTGAGAAESLFGGSGAAAAAAI